MVDDGGKGQVVVVVGGKEVVGAGRRGWPMAQPGWLGQPVSGQECNWYRLGVVSHNQHQHYTQLLYTTLHDRYEFLIWQDLQLSHLICH